MTPLEKAIQAAYDYHPYGLGLCYSGGWVIGPTFLVKAESGVSSTPPSSTLARMVKAILETAEEATCEVTIESSGHPKSPKVRIDRWGAARPTTPTKCTGRALRAGAATVGTEMPFPLLRLAGKLKPNRFSVKEDNVSVVHSWRDSELVGVFQARRCVDCVVTSKEAA